MDPMAIIAAGKAVLETGTAVAGQIVDMSEKVKDGAARREMDSRKLEASILYGKWATVFEGVGVATTAAQAISSIVKEQLESKAQAATVYAEIEDKHKQVNAEIENARIELEIAYNRANAEMEHQSKVDEQNYQLQLRAHETKLIELQKQFDTAEKHQQDSHEFEMTKLRFEHEREMEQKAIERLKAEKEADKIDAEIRQMDYSIERDREQVQLVINIVKKELQILMDMMQTMELTTENISCIQAQQTHLLQIMPKLQALPIHSV